MVTTLYYIVILIFPDASFSHYLMWQVKPIILINSEIRITPGLLIMALQIAISMDYYLALTDMPDGTYGISYDISILCTQDDLPDG